MMESSGYQWRTSPKTSKALIFAASVLIFWTVLLNADGLPHVIKAAGLMGLQLLAPSKIKNHEKRNRSEVSIFAIGFSVFAIPPEMKNVKLPDKFLYDKQPIESSGNFVMLIQVMKSYKLEPGEYLIVPATRYSRQCAKFILSIFLKSKSQEK